MRFPIECFDLGDTTQRIRPLPVMSTRIAVVVTRRNDERPPDKLVTSDAALTDTSPIATHSNTALENWSGAYGDSSVDAVGSAVPLLCPTENVNLIDGLRTR